MRVLSGPWFYLLGLTFCQVTSLFPHGLSLNIAFWHQAYLSQSLGRRPWLITGSPLFGVMVSPAMSSLILHLTGVTPLLLIPSEEVLMVAVGGLRYLRMTLVPCLLDVLGMWSCTLTLFPVLVFFGLFLASLLWLFVPRLVLAVMLLTFLMLGLLLN